MGWLIKGLLFFLVFSFIFRTISRFFFGSVIRQAQQQQQQRHSQQYQRTRPSDGNVNVDFAPKESRKQKSSDDFKGGDYVDYEELND